MFPVPAESLVRTEHRREHLVFIGLCAAPRLERFELQAFWTRTLDSKRAIKNDVRIDVCVFASVPGAVRAGGGRPAARIDSLSEKFAALY